jgi:predicted transposase/invertase (TIGR01784 family)
MKHRIDPKVDCVFKAILGSEDNRHLLVHFLNAILGAELSSPIVSVELLNPASDREFIDNKMHIVDVKARDNASRLFQVEIQMANERDLRQRVVYCWTDLFAKQLQSGERYLKLQPAYSIWLVNAVLTTHDPAPIHRYKIRDESCQTLIEHGGIWLIELKKCQLLEVATEEQRWLKLFIEGDTLNDVNLPEWMHTPEMWKAMKVLHDFSDKEENYHMYASRLDYQRVQRALEEDARESKAELEQAKNFFAQQIQQVTQQLQAAQEELARLKSGQR